MGMFIIYVMKDFIYFYYFYLLAIVLLICYSLCIHIIIILFDLVYLYHTKYT